LNTSWRSLSASRVQQLIYLALAAATLVVYARISAHDFINLDTYDYVLNSVAMNGMTQAGMYWAFTTDFMANWHPVTWLSHMLDVELFGFMAGAHHASSLLIHVLNVWLVFYLFNKMTHQLWPAALIAALFAIHPTHVESVAWVAERKDVLSGFFFLLSIGAYLRFIERPGIYRYASLLIFTALGLMSKPMLVTLPFVLLLLDYWPLQRLGQSQSQSVRYALLVELPRLVFEKIPLFVLVIASSAITYFVQQGAGAMNSGQHLTWYARISNAAVAYVFYLQKTLIPADLALFYPHPGQRPASEVVTSLVILGLISLVCLVKLKRAPYLFVGWCWFLGMLVPVIGFVQVGSQAAADRYTYLPTIGLSIVLVFGLAHLFERHRIRASIVASSAVLVLVFYAGVAWQYVGHWQNSITIWQHSLRVVDSNYLINAGLVMGEPEPKRTVPALAVPYMAMGNALEEKGQLDAALLHTIEANRLQPEILGPLLHLPVLYAALNHRQAALDAITKLTDLYPQNIEAREVIAAVHAVLDISALPAPRVDGKLPATKDE
jgi:tetratricopeptide (TPR) repeat protein